MSTCLPENWRTDLNKTGGHKGPYTCPPDRIPNARPPRPYYTRAEPAASSYSRGGGKGRAGRGPLWSPVPLLFQAAALEVKLVDVCTVEHSWWAKQDHVIGANCILTQLTSREHLADIPFDLAFR